MFVFWRASNATEKTAAELARGGEFPFQTNLLEHAVPPGIEVIPANPAFRDVALFQDTIVATGRGGLFVYDRAGTLIHSYRVGLELPPGEPGAMTAGMIAGASERELLIATRGAGLLAFNGERFRQFLPANPALRTITAVLALGSGRILLGTERNGVLVFDGRRIKPFHQHLESTHITALEGRDGDLWIATLQHGVFHHHAGQLDDLREALPDAQVLSLMVEDGTAWVGTPVGVVEFRDGRRTRTLGDGFFAQAMARQGDILAIGTEDEGVANIPLRSRNLPRAAPEANAPESVRHLANLGGDLFAVGEDAIYRFEPAQQTWRSVLQSSGIVLADRNVAALALDGGRLWVGYFDRGLDVVTPELDRVEHHEDDTLFCINRIVPDGRHDRTAVATANGLVLFDARARSRQVMGRKDGLLADHVTDVALREDGMVVATPAGLSFVDRFGVRSLYAFHGLVNNHVYTVAAMGNQTIAGTLGGVSVLDDDTVRANYTTANSHLRHNWITALARVGDTWFAGTYGAGVLRFGRNGDWRSFPDLKEGFVVNPNAMLVSGGLVYAGSLDHGLFIYDPALERWRNTTTGLPSLNVTALASGGGYLYAGTDNGVVRLREGALR